MSVRQSLFVSAAFALLCVVSAVHAVTIQSPDDILPDGSAFLWVEAEAVSELSGGNPADATTGFILVDNVNPFQTITEDSSGNPVVKGGQDVLPADTNASGGAAIFQALEGGGTAKWQLQFSTPATYYLFVHWTMYNRDTNTNYGNEDSFYVPPTFNKNATTDWIGFEGVDEIGDPKTGDGPRDGYIDGFPTIAQNYVSEGAVEVHNSTDEDFYEGQFHWYWLNRANDMDADGAFVSFSGHGIQYEVTEADVGTVLDFEIATREPYGAIDGLLFSTNRDLLNDYTQEEVDEFFLNRVVPILGDFDSSGALDLPDVNMLNAEIAAGTNNAKFDLNGDAAVNEADLGAWVKQEKKTWFGDANLDNEFNSGDLVAVFQVGRYEQDVKATWDEGDWNGDLRFNTSDLVKAFQDGGFERGPVAASAVPEPSGWIVLMAGLALFRRRRWS